MSSNPSNKELLTLIQKLFLRIRSLESQVGDLRRVIISANITPDDRGGAAALQRQQKEEQQDDDEDLTSLFDSIVTREAHQNPNNEETTSSTTAIASTSSTGNDMTATTCTSTEAPPMMDSDMHDITPVQSVSQLTRARDVFPLDEDVYLPTVLRSKLKPHQLLGVQFLWKNVYTEDSGCILADFMGLGKTLQTVSFLYVYFSLYPHTKVVILAPASVVKHWDSEFSRVNEWIRSDPNIENHTTWLYQQQHGEPIDSELQNRTVLKEIQPFVLTGSLQATDRSALLAQWSSQGGVVVCSYDLYRSLVFSGEASYSEALCSPGPDVIVLDEGHKIKHLEARISKALSNVQTPRRIVLTGYPLQNNLVEYWTMIDFVRFNTLGALQIFRAKFEKPIVTGSRPKAARHEQRIARRRAWLLHNTVKPFILRRDVSLLKNELPAKQEIVLTIRLSEAQKSLYISFIESMDEHKKQGRSWLFWAFDVITMLCNHPDILQKYAETLVQPTGIAAAAMQGAAQRDRTHLHNELKYHLEQYQSSSTAVPTIASQQINDSRDGGNATPTVEANGSTLESDVAAEQQTSNIEEEKQGREALMKSLLSQPAINVASVMEHSGKMVVLFSILEQSSRIGDRAVVFSRSLQTLDFIASLLRTYNSIPSNTVKLNFIRFDGSTSQENRQTLINEFNAEDTKINVFLISTLAGSEGINLYGANRVILFDVNWNPSHDNEACCRVYRYGQSKDVYIYRFITEGTMEQLIYSRQIKKQVLAKWVIDDVSSQMATTTDDRNLYDLSALLNPNYGTGNDTDTLMSVTADEMTEIEENCDDAPDTRQAKRAKLSHEAAESSEAKDTDLLVGTESLKAMPPVDYEEAVSDPVFRTVAKHCAKWISKVHIHDHLLREDPLEPELTEEEKLQAAGEAEWDSVYSKTPTTRKKREAQQKLRERITKGILADLDVPEHVVTAKDTATSETETPTEVPKPKANQKPKPKSNSKRTDSKTKPKSKSKAQSKAKRDQTPTNKPQTPQTEEASAASDTTVSDTVAFGLKKGRTVSHNCESESDEDLVIDLKTGQYSNTTPRVSETITIPIPTQKPATDEQTDISTDARGPDTTEESPSLCLDTMFDCTAYDGSCENTPMESTSVIPSDIKPQLEMNLNVTTVIDGLTSLIPNDTLTPEKSNSIETQKQHCDVYDLDATHESPTTANSFSVVNGNDVEIQDLNIDTLSSYSKPVQQPTATAIVKQEPVETELNTQVTDNEESNHDSVRTYESNEQQQHRQRQQRQQQRQPKQFSRFEKEKTEMLSKIGNQTTRRQQQHTPWNAHPQQHQPYAARGNRLTSVDTSAKGKGMLNNLVLAMYQQKQEEATSGNKRRMMLIPDAFHQLAASQSTPSSSASTTQTSNNATAQQDQRQRAAHYDRYTETGRGRRYFSSGQQHDRGYQPYPSRSRGSQNQDERTNYNNRTGPKRSSSRQRRNYEK